MRIVIVYMYVKFTNTLTLECMLSLGVYEVSDPYIPTTLFEILGQTYSLITSCGCLLLLTNITIEMLTWKGWG